MASIQIRGRQYTVETVEGASEKRYRLVGKRGASYFTMRNVHRPHMMFVVSHNLRSDAMKGVWLCDEHGALQVAEA